MLNTKFDRLIKALLKAGMTKVELADRLGCSYPTILKVATGENTDPQFSVGAGIIQLHDYHVKGIK